MAPAVDVKGHVAVIDAQSSNAAMLRVNDDSEDQGLLGGTNPSGQPATYATVAAGKKGEQYCKEFLKLDQDDSMWLVLT